MPRAILGPVLSDVQQLDGGRKLVLASGFYSAPRLNALTLKAESVDVMVRLNVNDWATRAIDPRALLRFWRRHGSINVSVYCSPGAHVKAYANEGAFLVGSSNFTMRGLAGTSDEILWYESDRGATRAMLQVLNVYKRSLEPLTLDKLEQFIADNEARVRRLRRQAKRSPEASLPPRFQRPTRLGYARFLSWLGRLESDAAVTIKARAEGQGNLQGHIRANFYGIRQFLIAHPTVAVSLRLTDPDTYQLSADGAMQAALARFVAREAVNEDDFNVGIWRTYLPMSAGGKPKTGGGTMGNLNRMLPLMARYLP